jgi:hypothetical protein
MHVSKEGVSEIAVDKKMNGKLFLEHMPDVRVSALSCLTYPNSITVLTTKPKNMKNVMGYGMR